MTRKQRIKQLQGFCEEVIRRSPLMRANKDDGEIECGLDEGKAGTIRIVVKCSTGSEIWRQSWPPGASTYEWVMTHGPGVS